LATFWGLELFRVLGYICVKRLAHLISLQGVNFTHCPFLALSKHIFVLNVHLQNVGLKDHGLPGVKKLRLYKVCSLGGKIWDVPQWIFNLFLKERVYRRIYWVQRLLYLIGGTYVYSGNGAGSPP